MKYALGNMLNGAGSLNPDGLSLDLQFAADKTLTARKGPTPTFTRSSGATQVGATGLIEYAPENLILQSENFGTTWAVNNALTVTSNSVTAPDGTLTADALNFDSNAGSRIIQFAGSAVVHTFSVWLRAAAPTTCIIATTAAGSAGDSITASVTTEWQRFSVVATTWVTGTASFSCRIVNNAAGTTGTIFIWGAQLERHTSAHDYIPTTTAAVYGPRFDHDPITLACKGLLIEESRTNLILQSEDFGTTWAATQSTVSTNVATAPDGLVTADKIISNSGAGALSRFSQSLTLTGAHVMSVFAKASEWGWVLVAYGPANSTGVWFDLTNGTIGTQSAGFVGSIIPYGNGWYKCVVSFTGAGTSLVARVRAVNADNQVTTGDGTSGIFIWGAQLEAGAFPTSYIPTVASSVVRSADVCSITGSAFSNLWNTSGGTFLFEGFLIPGISTTINQRMLSSGGSRRWLYGNQPGIGTVGETLTLFDGTSTPNYFTNVRIATRFKMAISVEALTCKASFNGSAISTASHNGNLLNSVTLLGFFETASGFITGVKYFRKNLSNAKLQAITA